MVGTGMSNVAAMAGRLHSQHRWAVTGTPIGPGGLDDIQGLLRVLQHDPFADPMKWKWCIAEPYLTGLCLLSTHRRMSLYVTVHLLSASNALPLEVVACSMGLQTSHRLQ